jgi:hypothetical protein
MWGRNDVLEVLYISDGQSLVKYIGFDEMKPPAGGTVIRMTIPMVIKSPVIVSVARLTW